MVPTPLLLGDARTDAAQVRTTSEQPFRFAQYCLLNRALVNARTGWEHRGRWFPLGVGKLTSGPGIGKTGSWRAAQLNDWSFRFAEERDIEGGLRACAKCWGAPLCAETSTFCVACPIFPHISGRHTHLANIEHIFSSLLILLIQLYDWYLPWFWTC